VVKKEGEETLAQQRDRLGLSARVPARATRVLIQIEDSTSEEDMDGGEEDTSWGEEVWEEEEEEDEEEGDAEEDEGEEAEEDEGEEAEEDEGGEEWEEEQEVDGDHINGLKRARAEASAAAALPSPLLQLAAPAPPPRLPPPPPQHVDVKWVEGQGQRCARSDGNRRGTHRWRCSSAAVPGSTHCAHHATLNNAYRKRARLNLAGSVLPVPAGDDEGGATGRGLHSFTSQLNLSRV